MATFGDSHTVELAYALAGLLEFNNKKLKHFSFSGCPPMYQNSGEQTSNYCANWTNEAVKYINSNANIEYVVVSYRINLHLYGGHEDQYPRLPDEKGESERLEIWKTYVNTINSFVSHGKNVILILQAPELPIDVHKLIYYAQHPDSRIGGVSKSWWDARNNFVVQHLNQISSQVVIINPADFLCNEIDCMVAKNGTAFYFDDDHMSVEGANLIAKEVIKKIGFSRLKK